MFRWLIGRPYRRVARGRLSVVSYRWAAVPGREAWAFKERHPAAVNALSFAHIMRGLAARFPRTAERAARALTEVTALEAAHPDCVVFVLDAFDL